MRTAIRVFLSLTMVIVFNSNICIAGISYEKEERSCKFKGWQKISQDINGLNRQLFWKGPEGTWQNGAIIVLHGGGGSYTNWCGNMRICKPMAEFSDLAIKNGFAIFAIDSSDGEFKDEAGNSCGKRFDFTAGGNRENLELPFFEIVLNEIIPGLRPQNSARDIFMAGISNGGFMAMRAATHFDNKITAFALVSAGDPYGSFIDCQESLTPRQGAPGLFYDNQTKINIGELNACLADSYADEKEWETANPSAMPAFKQFHHQGDAGVDLSCMSKAQALLKEHGYNDDGPYIIKDNQGKKKLWKHFWQRAYNQPLIQFFLKYKTKVK